jgi:hypothetical protein
VIVERHQDYQLTVPTVPPGGVQNVPLQLDSDAPFALRLVKSRNLGPDGWRFQNPKRQYQSTELQTDLIQDATTDTYVPSRGVVMYPQMIYQPGASIVCDIGNDTGENLTNVKLLFRGSKLFDSRAVSLPTYPPKMSGLPFTYQTIVRGVTATGKLPDNQLRVQDDADFVLRCGLADPYMLVVDGTATSVGFAAPPNYSELYVTIRDESRKPYSNEPIHVNDLFGQQVPFEDGPHGNLNSDIVAWLPGLFTPEIYIPRDHSLYFDLVRFDDPTDQATGQTVDMFFRFVGAKVFAQ